MGTAGEATASASLEGFEQLREQVGRMAGSITALEERTRQIGGITQTVKDLADQSISATGRAREILEDVQRAIRATASLSEEGQRRTEVGLAQVRASGESLRRA